jgi:hypothetical protein
MRYSQCYVTVIYAVKRWKSSAVYQLRRVRTYAIGDIDGRADLLAQLFAGSNATAANATGN